MYEKIISFLLISILFSCGGDKAMLSFDLPNLANTNLSFYQWNHPWGDPVDTLSLDKEGKATWNALEENGYYLLLNSQTQEQVALVYLDKDKDLSLTNKEGSTEIEFNDPDNTFINVFRTEVRSIFVENQNYLNLDKKDFLNKISEMESKVLSLHKEESENTSNLISNTEKQNALYSLEFLKLNYLEKKELKLETEIRKSMLDFGVKVKPIDHELFFLSDAYRDFLSKYYYLLTKSDISKANSSLAVSFLNKKFDLPKAVKEYILFEFITGFDGEKAMNDKDFREKQLFANKTKLRSAFTSKKMQKSFDDLMLEFEKLSVEKVAAKIGASNRKNTQFSWENYKGKPVILDIWASWCRPCIQQLPALDDLKVKYKNQLQIVGISLDDDKTRWKNALDKYKLTQNQYIVNQENVEEFSSDYSISTIPHYILIDAKGIIIDDDIRYIRNLDNGEFNPDLIKQIEKLIQ